MVSLVEERWQASYYWTMLPLSAVFIMPLESRVLVACPYIDTLYCHALCRVMLSH